MPNIKRISVVALVLLLVGITGSILTLGTKKSAEEISEQRTFEKGTFTNVDIHVDNAEVEIVPVNNETAKVELSGDREKDRKYSFDAAIEGDTLAVQLNEEKLKFYNFDFFESALAIKVYVPEKSYGKLRVNVGNGNVKAEKLGVKDVAVKTINGTIDLKYFESDNVAVESKNGKIHLENIDGDLSGDVLKGKISLLTKDLSQNIDFETTNGQIDIQTEKEPTNATISAEAVNGTVDVFGDSSRRTVIGNGENSIKLSTLNGKVTVSK